MQYISFFYYLCPSNTARQAFFMQVAAWAAHYSLIQAEAQFQTKSRSKPIEMIVASTV